MEAHNNGGWLTCNRTIGRVKGLDTTFKEYITPADPLFGDMARHLIDQGGKRLRPSLFFLAASFGPRYGREFNLPAAALELLHVASLYHDDIMDRAQKRRSVSSVNGRWGNSAATYVGTYLFARAIEWLSLCGEAVNRLTAPYIAALCLGQLQEAENAYNTELRVTTHLDIIEKKTASLFELPCHLGALLGGANQGIIMALQQYGRCLGLSFQIADDILDLEGYSQKTGKQRGTDLKEGVYGLATLHALEKEHLRAPLADLLLLQELGEEELEKAIALIRQSGAIEAARHEGQRFSEQALAALSLLPEGQAKESLTNLASYVLTRDT